MSKLISWPDDWPQYKQTCFASWEKRCDMLVGPCFCGAWHQPGEVAWRDGHLYRCGELVPQRAAEPVPI